MPRALKTYVTSIGFFDLAVAAPSMKAALEAWGGAQNLFNQGFAKETHDPAIVKAAMAKPGTVLKRAVGSNGAFTEDAALPKSLPVEKLKEKRPTKAVAKKAAPKPSHAANDNAKVEAAKKKAQSEFEKAQKKRAAERAKEEAAARKEQEKREAAIAKAEAALDEARDEHQAALDAIERDRAAIEKRIDAEEVRWQKEKERLRDAIDRARSA
jgi:colicin import membrane protein